MARPHVPTVSPAGSVGVPIDSQYCPLARHAFHIPLGRRAAPSSSGRDREQLGVRSSSLTVYVLQSVLYWWALYWRRQIRDYQRTTEIRYNVVSLQKNWSGSWKNRPGFFSSPPPPRHLFSVLLFFAECITTFTMTLRCSTIWDYHQYQCGTGYSHGAWLEGAESNGKTWTLWTISLVSYICTSVY